MAIGENYDRNFNGYNYISKKFNKVLNRFIKIGKITLNYTIKSI